MPDKVLHTYRVLVAPVLKRMDGVTDDPVALEVAEMILVAAESADGVGMTRSEIATRAGLDSSDDRFCSRFTMLVKAGALQTFRGEKKHQDRYFPDPMALLAAEILARLSEDQGAEELHSILVAAAEELEAALDPTRGPESAVNEVANQMARLSTLLHAYAHRMEAATAAGTYEDLLRARSGSSTGRQMTQIRRICHAIGRDDSPYRGLFDDANHLISAGQRFVGAAEALTARLVEVTASGGGVLSLASYDDYRNAAVEADVPQLSAVGDTVPLEGMPPLVHFSDMAQAAASLDEAPRTRSVPEPPSLSPAHDQRAVLVERRRLAERRWEARRTWAAKILADVDEVDLTSQATTWPHAARLLADVIAISRDPAVPIAGDIGDPPLVQPGHEVALRHPLRLRRMADTEPTRRMGTPPSEYETEEGS